MRLSLLQLNIQCGRKLAEIVAYCNEQSFDVIHFQEVAGGEVSFSGKDNFRDLKKGLKMDGVLSVGTQKKGEMTSYYGLATFYKPKLKVRTSEVIWLNSYFEFDKWLSGGQFAKDLPRHALATKFCINKSDIWTINTHLAWGPTPLDEPYKIAQASRLINYVKSLNSPFVLTGDFNVTQDSEIVRRMDQIAVNHAANAGLMNTLNPALHRVRDIFPLGLAVDYIFTSFDLATEDFSLVDSPDLSDHFGLKIIINV